LKSDRELKTSLKTAEFELLVPAANKETAEKAVLAGADALYAGYSKYGARLNAGNSISDLIEMIDFAHIYGVKVYIALNTILNDEEIIKAEKLICRLYDIKADGIIIQDMGILELDIPPVPLIASTQCHNISIEKIKFFEKTGFKRVILPRELSLKEIREIRKHTNIELECFVHGALCMSYSGQCYMSLANGGRSANRGICAQCCRKKYSLKDAEGKYIARNKHILSLKDLNLSMHLEDLISAGINSFKIEGRLKNEAYVINTAAYYRKLIDKILAEYSLKRSSEGVSRIDFEPDVNKTFNRSYTDYNFTGYINNAASVNYTGSLGEFTGIVKNSNKNYFTLNSNILNNGDGICFFNKYNELTGTNINKTEGSLIFPAEIQGIKEGVKIYRNYDKEFEDKLKSADLTRQLKAFLRVRETNTGYWFFLRDEKGNCAVHAIGRNFEPALNRQKALDILRVQLEKSGGTEFKIEAGDIVLKTAPHLKVSCINEIRRILTAKLRQLRRKNYKIEYREQEKTIAAYPYDEADFRANIFNEKAAEFYRKRGVKIKEYALEAQKDCTGRTVMTSKYCLKNQFGLCSKQNAAKKFKEPFTLIDEKGREYKVEFDCRECNMKIRMK